MIAFMTCAIQRSNDSHEIWRILADVSSHMSCSEAVYWGLPNIPFYLK